MATNQSKPKRKFRRAAQLKLHPRGAEESIECHLEFLEGPPVAFYLDPRAAMTVMVALQAYQKRYHWPIPMMRVFREKK